MAWVCANICQSVCRWWKEEEETSSHLKIASEKNYVIEKAEAKEEEEEEESVLQHTHQHTNTQRKEK